MHPRSRTSRRALAAVAAVGAAALVAGAASGPAAAATVRPDPHSRHVLLLSIDGMHQADLQWYVAHHPHSTLAALVAGGSEFTQARTPFPSDSFPGTVAQVTGGNPKTTGIYYDVTYNHALIDPSASKDATPDPSVCAHPMLGANVAFDESIDRDSTRLDAGQGLASLPQDILQMTPDPQTLIDPTKLPIDPKTCTRVYPHSYLKVNTVFNVAKAHGLRTAWSDKHPAYEILNGPSGNGIDDLFAPEINSKADAAGDDWTGVNSLTQEYDHAKVEAVLNEIKGFDHSGRQDVGMPGIFGMNFQTVSTAQKLPTSGGQPGGYNAAGTQPGPVLRGALNYVDRGARLDGDDAEEDRPLPRHHDHSVGEARSVTDGRPLPQADRRRHHHRRAQRRMEEAAPRRRPAAGPGVAERRRHAAVVQQRRPHSCCRCLRSQFPSRLPRHRHRSRRTGEGDRHRHQAGRLHRSRASDHPCRRRRGALHRHEGLQIRVCRT